MPAPAEDGTFYYVMELIDGVTLSRVVDVDGPLAPGRVVHVLQQAAAALDEGRVRALLDRLQKELA